MSRAQEAKAQPMMHEEMKCSDRARAILWKAQLCFDHLGVVDVLVAIMTVECGVGQQVLNEAGVRRQDLLDLLPTANPSTSLAVVQRTAECEARDLEYSFVGSEPLLLACLKLVDRMPEKPLILQAKIPFNYACAKDAVKRVLGTPAPPGAHSPDEALQCALFTQRFYSTPSISRDGFQCRCQRCDAYYDLSTSIICLTT